MSIVSDTQSAPFAPSSRADEEDLLCMITVVTTGKKTGRSEDLWVGRALETPQ